ncbi:MAG: hypothetical protein IKI31_06580 [Treponema sp.]|nr:hypothetical protein [Treponema sp.]
MKKILAIAAAVILGVTSLHAVDIELDVLYFPWSFNSASTVSYKGKSLDKDLQSQVTYNSPFLALGLNANFYFVQKDNISMGLSAVGGFDIGFLTNMPKNISASSSSSGPKANVAWGGGGFLKAGFACRIDFTDVHALYVSPGLILTGATGSLKTFGVDNRISTFYVGLDIDVGYRAFFVHNSNFDFGIDCGLNIDFPIGGVVSDKYGKADPLSYGAFGGGFKLYVGPAFRLK